MEDRLIEVLAERTPPKPNATDAAFERETVITWSDGDQVITISTSQARTITSLKNNPAARLISTDGSNYVFELPMGLVTLRKGKRTGTTKRTVAAKSITAAKCGHIKPDGTACQMVAKKDTGKCRWHS